jgi:predicted N-acetyltransferase YhbS
VLPHPEAPNTIRGYYTLSAYSVRLPDLPPSVIKKLPRYPDVPAALLGRLAVDRTCQHQGLGEHLMLDAMSKVLTHSEAMGTVVLVVDAKHEKSATYYQAHGFIPFSSEPLRLFMHLDTIALALAPL